MSTFEASITNSKKQLEFYKQLSEQLQQENKKLNGTIQTYDILLKSNIEENKQLKEVIDKAIKYIECHKYTIKHYEPYGTPTGLSNYETYNIKGYYQLLDILKEVSE